MNDEQIKKEYYAMYPKYEYISPKKRKAKFLSALKGWDEKDLMKKKSKQLGKIIFNLSPIINL